jgi:phage tail-like protein
MRPSPPTFFPLDGRTGWRTSSADGTSVDARGLLQLAADPAGPLALTSPDGSLGGLTLPDGLALMAPDTAGTLYLLPPSEPRVLRFDAEQRRFVPLPEVGGEGTEPRRFRQPSTIAVAGCRLWVADLGNRRVQVFDLRSLALVQVWGPWDWEPVDVAAQGGAVWVLDRRHGRVFRPSPGTSALVPVVDEPAAAGRWTHLAVDRDDRVYLLDPAVPRLEVYGPDGRRRGEVHDAGEARSRFDEPAVRLDSRGRFRLPDPSDPRFFDRSGRPVLVDPAEPAGPPLYRTAGTWISAALDSRIYRCPWHRVELELAELPPGSRMVVSTYADESPDALEAGIPEHAWQTRFAVVGPLEPTDFQRAHEFLVLSGPGQHLWVRIELRADGFETPAVRGLRIHYPRQSYLSFLPAVYAAEEVSRSFLERFLSIVQTEWDGLERRIAEIPRLFDPAAVPAGELLEYLADWLALPLEGSWDGEQQRRLLAAAPRLYARRGTVEGLRDVLRIYLQNLAGVTPEEQGGYPAIVEGFRERRRLLLSTPMGRGAPLWSAGVVGRLRLGVFARAGEVRLVSTGDPERDLFHEHAHRFRVFVPAAWVRTAADEQKLRRALEMEKPAHTAYELCLVEPRFRVGVQSTVGLDTVIGGLPVARLACRCVDDEPPGRAPRGRLGYDTVLAGAPGLRRGEAPRVGVETILT